MSERPAGERKGAEDPSGAALPIFYRQVRPLDAARHGTLALRGEPDFRFAAGATAIPLMAEEFAAALGHYPIVFTAGERPMAVAVVGVRAGTNLFVDAGGRWRADAYIPAYVRRYPFIFLESQGDDRLVLCIDEASDLAVPGGDKPLFADGKPASAVDDALKFCAAFREQSQATRSFIDALLNEGLLVEQRADIQFRSGERAQVNGFLMIDRQKLDALPAATVVDWQRRGWLLLVHAHLLSLPRFTGLADLAG